MNPLNPEEAKAKIIKDLEISHLPQEEREEIVSTLAEALLERATTIIMAKMPESALDEIERFAQSDDQESIKAKIAELVPDAAEIVDSVIKDGISQYKQLVEKEERDSNDSDNRVNNGNEQEEIKDNPSHENSVEVADPSEVTEEHFVVGEDGEAKPAGDAVQNTIGNAEDATAQTISTDAGELPSADDLQMPDTSIPEPLINPKSDQPAY